jgi:hypothetical protein
MILLADMQGVPLPLLIAAGVICYTGLALLLRLVDLVELSALGRRLLRR